MKTLLFLMTLALSLMTINGQTTTNFSSLASITPGTNDEIVIYTRPGTNAVARRASLQKVISSVGLATEAGALENGIFGGQRLTRVLFVGDSMSDAGWSYPSAALQTAWKLKTLYGDGGNALGNLQSGNNNSYYYPEAAIWPSVRMASVRAGESVIGQQDPNYVLLGGYPIAYAGDAKISGVYYAKWPKGGNLAITNSHMTSGLASVGTVVSTYSATTNIGYTAFNTTSNDNRLTLTGVSGSNVVLGVRFAPTNGPGVETFWYSLSGISMPDQLNPGTNALTDFRDLVQPDVIFYHAKDSDVSLSTYYAQITTLIGSLATTNTKVFLVGTCPDLVVSDASLRAYNGVLEAVARSNNWGYIDLATAYPNIRRLQEIGYMEAGDSAVHPLTNGAKAFADTIIRGMTTAQKSTASTAGAAVPDMLGVKQIAAASGKGADFDPAMILGADVNAFTTTSGAEKAGYIAGLQLNNTRFAINRYYVNGLGNISLTFGGEGSTTPGFSRGPDQTHFGTRNFLSWTINSEGNFVPGSGGAIGYESATNNSIGTAALPVPRSYTKTSEGRSGKGTDFDPAMILGADVNAFTVTTNSEKAGYIAGLQYDNSRFAIAKYYSSGAGNISLTFGGEGSTIPGYSLGPDATHFGTRNFLSWTIDQSGNFVPGAGGIPGYLSATNNTIGTAALPVPRIYATAITLNGSELTGGTSGGSVNTTNLPFVGAAGSSVLIRTNYATNNAAWTRLVWKGDSITLGTGNSAGRTYPWWVTYQYLTNGNFTVGTNAGHAGQVLSTMLTAYSSEVSPWKPSGGTNALLFLLGGVNDLAAGATALSIHSNLNQYAIAARADGFTVYIGTVIPFLTATSVIEFERNALNTMIRTGTNAFIDFDAGFATPPDNTWFSDYIHPADFGYKSMARMAYQTVFQGVTVPPTFQRGNPILGKASVRGANTSLRVSADIPGLMMEVPNGAIWYQELLSGAAYFAIRGASGDLVSGNFIGNWSTNALNIYSNVVAGVSVVASNTIAAHGGFVIPTNKPPSASPYPGAGFLWNSNGTTTYYLKSSSGSTAWSSTNLWF